MRAAVGWAGRWTRVLLLAAAGLAAAQTNMYMENLPDGMHSVLISRRGGLYITGFDSRRRVCLVLFAPPLGSGLRTVSELPYRDYGRWTPSVLAAHDPARADSMYVLLYLHPDNLGLEQMSLYRLDVLTGRQVLLTASSSPFWPPTGILPRADGSVLVALGGLGPLLEYSGCDEAKCEPAKAVNSTASFTPGKGGLAEVDGMVCMVVLTTAVYGEGGRLVCVMDDGSLVPITATNRERSKPPEPRVNEPHGVTHASSKRRGLGKALNWRSRAEGGGDGSGGGGGDDSREDGDRVGGSRGANASALGSLDDVTNPTLVVSGEGDGDSPHTLYVVSREAVNEFGYAQGSVHVLTRRNPNPGETCGGAGCWEAPRLVVRSMSNPRGVAIDAASGTLYVVEQNTLRGYSYETFHGDVLAFCARGRYDCANAQNSGECVCLHGYGGACCDIELEVWISWFVATATSSFPLAVALLGVCGLMALAYRFRNSTREDGGASSPDGAHAFALSSPHLDAPTIQAAFGGAGAVAYSGAPVTLELAASTRLGSNGAQLADPRGSMSWDVDDPNLIVATTAAATTQSRGGGGGPTAPPPSWDEGSDPPPGWPRPPPDWLDELRAPLMAAAQPPSAPPPLSTTRLTAAPPPVHAAAATSASGAPAAAGAVACGSGVGGGSMEASPPSLSALQTSSEQLMRSMLYSTDTLESDGFSPRLGPSAPPQSPPPPMAPLGAPTNALEPAANLGVISHVSEVAPPGAGGGVSDGRTDGTNGGRGRGRGRPAEDRRPMSPTMHTADMFDLASALSNDSSVRPREARE